jgi:hypothetical protein
MKIIETSGILILLLLVFSVLSNSCEKLPEPNITDEFFLKYLIEAGIDTNGDGRISPSEAETVDSLSLIKDGISDLTGIEMFVNLKVLDCSLNYINEFKPGLVIINSTVRPAAYETTIIGKTTNM